MNGVTLPANGAEGGGHNRVSQGSFAASERCATSLSTRAPTPGLGKAMPRRAPLAPPPALTFDAEPIQWKSMTLDAAQWTFTSDQLQETVSRAIRQSAAESFIRVVSTQTVDVELPEELERLDQVSTCCGESAHVRPSWVHSVSY